ncbi:calmodulin, putative [Hepatocystis sp. ex Piliocolobus tephrosceles]|nr:calmodulin, putative [Hepatocystis sp. ex Piliocolobus tephrosceles]
MEYEGETFQLTTYQIKKTVKAFKYLDKKKKGLLKFDLLGSLLRCSGYNVSLREIQNIKEKIIENKIKRKNKEIIEKRENEITQDEETNKLDKDNLNSSNKKNNGDDDYDDNMSELLDNFKNYDNFIELEKKKKEMEKKREEDKNRFSIKEFFQIIQIPNITNETKPANVLNSFELFDEEGNGKISIKKLRFILQYLGEPLSNKEFDEFFEWMKTKGKAYKNDHIIYEELLNELTNKDVNM